MQLTKFTSALLLALLGAGVVASPMPNPDEDGAAGTLDILPGWHGCPLDTPRCADDVSEQAPFMTLTYLQPQTPNGNCSVENQDVEELEAIVVVWDGPSATASQSRVSWDGSGGSHSDISFPCAMM